MNWYKNIKTAEEIGHGDTFYGQYLTKERERLCKDVSSLRTAAATGGPEDVLPRWRGEVRQQIFRLPSVERIGSMSMFELGAVADYIDGIKAEMRKYSTKRFLEYQG